MNRIELRSHRTLVLVIVILALAYAFCAGFRTIGDVDFGWQIASGRFIAQHHQIIRTDVFTYTIPGTEWLYPPLGQLVFYWVYLLGGYAALSWLLAGAAVLTFAVLLRKPGIATGIAAILAVPSIVFRESVRAELFTTLFFAIFLSILWRFFREGRGRLWLLPILMLLWVNLHPGFFSGLALLVGYVVLELCEMPFADRRAAAWERLRKSGPWIVASFAATLVNPWGPKIYAAISRQNRVVTGMPNFLAEWSKPNLSTGIFQQVFRWRDPESAFWWLFAFAVIAIVAALWRKQIGPAVLLVSASFLSIQYLRFQGLFACVAVVVGGAMLDEYAWLPLPKQAANEQTPAVRPTWLTAAAALVCAAMGILVGVRCADLITNRHYIESGEVVLFGSGEATWFPEGAVAFVRKNQLPGNLFNDFNLGGFLEWDLPEYKTYVDSRAVPFGAGLLLHQQNLLGRPLDSPEWTREAEERNINLLVLSTDRYLGLGKAPLDVDCASHNWRPVYLDETSAVFLRNTTDNAALIQRLGIDCGTVAFVQPEDARGNSLRAKGNAYYFFANSGSLAYLLGRDQEAQQFLARAESIEAHDSNLHLTRAQLLQADGRTNDAEREYKASIKQRPTDLAWYLLALLYGRERRYSEAAQAMMESARLSYNPGDRYRMVGQIDNAMGLPSEALKAFDLAESAGLRAPGDQQKAFRAQVASGRAHSWQLLHDLNRAVEEQRKSVELLPNDSARWTTLAQLLRDKGDLPAAEQAQAKADSLRAAGSAH